MVLHALRLGAIKLGSANGEPFLGRDMGHEPDYSEEIAREIDDEVRRIIEDGHELASRVLREHLDDLHRISQILIERETIDKDEFERLVAGESEESVFAEEDVKPSLPEPAREPERRPQTKPRPFPLPGATMQPPKPEAS